jgi:hypothetical protein
MTIRLRNEGAVLAAAGGVPERFYRASLQPFKLLSCAAHLKRRGWRSDLLVLWKTVRAVRAPSSVSPPSPGEMQARVDRWQSSSW